MMCKGGLSLNSKKMSKNAKRTLIICGTIVGSIALTMIIAFFPSCEKETRYEEPNSDIMVDVPDADIMDSNIGGDEKVTEPEDVEGSDMKEPNIEIPTAPPNSGNNLSGNDWDNNESSSDNDLSDNSSDSSSDDSSEDLSHDSTDTPLENNDNDNTGEDDTSNNNTPSTESDDSDRESELIDMGL